MEHKHEWNETGRVAVHAYGNPVTYVRCTCGQSGFRRPGSKVVFTWRKNDEA